MLLFTRTTFPAISFRVLTGSAFALSLAPAPALAFDLGGLLKRTPGGANQRIRYREKSFIRGAEYFGPQRFEDVVRRYYRTPVREGGKATRVHAAETVAKAARVYDKERGGFQALRDIIAKGNAPELIAAVFGETVKRDMNTIRSFYERHFGKSIKLTDPKLVSGVLEGLGIGGQRNVSGMTVGLENPFPNRWIKLHSAFGAPIRETGEHALEQLRRFHGDLDSAEDRLQLLIARQERFKFLRRVSSKSGTTPETMVGFQKAIKESVRAFSRFVYGDGKGALYAEKMLRTLYNGEDLLTGGVPIRRLDGGQRMMLALVLDRIVLATGKRKQTTEVFDDRARVGDSMFDAFAKAANRELKTEFAALGTDGMSVVRVYDRFGGRTNVGGPDAFANMMMDAFDGSRRDPMRAFRKHLRPLAKLQSKVTDQSLLGKQLAAFSHAMGLKSIYVGLPTSLMHRVVDGVQQQIGESIDVGALVDGPMGVKAVVHPTRLLARKSHNRKDNGKRLYLLLTDKLADGATRRAERQIIEREAAKGNHVVRLEIDDHGRLSTSGFAHTLLDYIGWYGDFMAADVAGNIDHHQGLRAFAANLSKIQAEEVAPVDFDASDGGLATASALYANKPLSPGEPRHFTGLRKVLLDLNVFFQPGVEEGKTLGKKLAKKLYVVGQREIVNPLTGKKLTVPIRGEHAAWMDNHEQKKKLAEHKGAYVVGNAIHRQGKAGYVAEDVSAVLPERQWGSPTGSLDDVETHMRRLEELRRQQEALPDQRTRWGRVLRKKRRREYDALEDQVQKIMVELRRAAENVAPAELGEQAAVQTGQAAAAAHLKGQGVAASLYAGRQALEKLGFEHMCRDLEMFDTFQYAPDKQHTDADGDIAGTTNNFQILAHVRQPHGEKVVTDGMVAPHWHGLSEQSLIYVNHQAYSQVYKDRHVDHAELRLEGGTLKDVARMYAFFVRANQAYLQAIRKAERSD